MMRRRLPVPELAGVKIDETSDGLVIRTRDAPDVDEGLRKLGPRFGVSWDIDANAWRTTPASYLKVTGRLRTIAKARALNKDSN